MGKSKIADGLRDAIAYAKGDESRGKATTIEVVARGSDHRANATIHRLLAENDRLRTALRDAINSPKGVVPDSAVPFYDPEA